jgi:hypothetical protein
LLDIKLRTSQGERVFIEESREFEHGQSCMIQDNQVVQSRNLQNKSEGQPPKPTFTVRAGVIAAQCPYGADLVDAGGDDPLVKHETMSRLNCEEPNSVPSLEKGSAIGLDQSCLCSLPNANLQTSKSSRFVGCSSIKSIPQVSRSQVRQVRLKDCEDFLKKDSRFWWAVDQLRFLGPGPERHKFCATPALPNRCPANVHLAPTTNCCPGEGWGGEVASLKWGPDWHLTQPAQISPRPRSFMTSHDRP